jgi:two-component system response regulator AtoC
LRVLQENEIRAVGDTKTKKIDVRVIAATSRDLEDEVARGMFREDLFYRLNVLRIHMPPLREWKEDIPLLCRHFLNLFKERLGREIRDIHPDAVNLLAAHHWPGNVRELEHVIERAVVLADGNTLVPENLPTGLGTLDNEGKTAGVPDGYSLKSAQKIVEKRLIVRALRATEGNRTRASKLLEISHPSLLSKMKTYGIDM